MCLDLSLAFFTLTFSEWFIFESLYFLLSVAFNNSAVNHRVHAYTILPATSYCFNTILIDSLRVSYNVFLSYCSPASNSSKICCHFPTYCVLSVPSSISLKPSMWQPNTLGCVVYTEVQCFTKLENLILPSLITYQMLRIPQLRIGLCVHSYMPVPSHARILFGLSLHKSCILSQ